ncbi:MAG: methyltransferase domain-containing protein [Candidatus Dependentiae bacterium]|jgi:phospholipid N-methyltransferase
MKILKKLSWWLGTPALTIIVLYLVLVIAGGSSVGESLSFLWRFLHRPHEIGSIAPSSNKLATALLARMPEKQGRAILEVGAGTGAVTKHLVHSLRPGDSLDVLELDAELATGLQNYYRGMRNVRIHHGSILQWSPGCKYDAIISGVPFNAMKYNQVRSIFAQYRALLKPDGVLSYFSYAGLPQVKGTFLPDSEKKDFESIQEFLADEQRENGLDRTTVMANLPPAHVHYLSFRKRS